MPTLATRERECIDCPRTFQGAHRRCTPCRSVERVCTCGVKFRSHMTRCAACRRQERVCVCGKAFRGTNAQCKSCQVSDQVCVCGKAFRGTDLRCRACRVTDRSCVDCGEAFRGTSTRCSPCRLPNRVCACGRAHQGTNTRCPGCYASERVCACGKAFRGSTLRCDRCRWNELPVNLSTARRRGYRNARRARKVNAQVAGPVSTADYAGVLAEGPCVYCGASANTVDHVHPLTRGGPECVPNLVPACLSCNSSKGNRLLTEWRADRVAHGVAHSPKVSAEYVRLTSENTMREVV